MKITGHFQRRGNGSGEKEHIGLLEMIRKRQTNDEDEISSFCLCSHISFSTKAHKANGGGQKESGFEVAANKSKEQNTKKRTSERCPDKALVPV